MEDLREPVEEPCNEDICHAGVLLFDSSVSSKVTKHATVEKIINIQFVLFVLVFFISSYQET